MHGRKFSSNKQQWNARLNNITLQFPENITSGTYMARLETNGEVTFKKIIVNK